MPFIPGPTEPVKENCLFPFLFTQLRSRMFITFYRSRVQNSRTWTSLLVQLAHGPKTEQQQVVSVLNLYRANMDVTEPPLLSLRHLYCACMN